MRLLLDRVLNGLPLGHRLDLNAVENVMRCYRGEIGDRFEITKLPPVGVTTDQRPRMTSCRNMRQFLEDAFDDDASPFTVVASLVYFDADLRVAAHPVDFLSGDGEAVEMMFLKDIVNWNHVGLPVLLASQSRQALR